MDIFYISLLAAMVNSLFIGIAYMLSKLYPNPKLSLWAKTEAVQLVVSAISVILILSIINIFNHISLSSLSQLTGGYVKNIPIYNAAEEYLIFSSGFAHTSALYALDGLRQIDVCRGFSRWKCTLNPCWMATGGTGETTVPYMGYSYITPIFSFEMTSSLASYLSSSVNLLFYKYIRSLVFLFLLPLGIIFRNLPFMRKVGAIFISVIFSFYVIYPFILASFYTIYGNYQINIVSNGIPSSSLNWFSGVGDVQCSLNSPVSGAILTSYSFFFAIFIPTLSLLAASATSVFFARTMGEEINLSRILQMV